ncbi:MAG: hypothetical protein J6Y20_14900 [Lachnospiraceae bacterium]|nr:hypothetical protein [Lachnospiraceae bacterium]
MKRRNPATASSPSPQFELTSFMDVIFIFLFVVMIGYALKSAAEADNAKNKMSEAEEILADAEEKLAAADEKVAEADEKLADIEVYKQQLRDLKDEVVGTRVQIVTITCTYDIGSAEERENLPRHLRVLGYDQKMLVERDFTEKNEKNTYEILRETLEKYVKSVKQADRELLGDRYDTDKQARTVIVFSISRKDGGILTRDYEAISTVIRELESAYDDIY